MSAPQPAKVPARTVLEGHYVRLEPLTLDHAPELYRASNPADAAERFAYLPDIPPVSEAAMLAWVHKAASMSDPMMFAVVDRLSGKAVGRQALMRIVPEHGVIEIGNIYWGPGLARTRGATEALYLFAGHIFDDLGYRRFEWKCNDRNLPSKRAATRFGFTFEGVFRQHMIAKGENRDTAWFSMLDGEWPARRAEFERWLDPANFDAEGRQLTPLGA